MSAELHSLGVAGLSRALASRETSSEELVKHLLARIDARQQLGAFLHVDSDGALQAARAERGRTRRS